MKVEYTDQQSITTVVDTDEFWLKWLNDGSLARHGECWRLLSQEGHLQTDDFGMDEKDGISLCLQGIIRG